MADFFELPDDAANPTMNRARGMQNVSNWREYARNYAEDLRGTGVSAIWNNICKGARPSYVCDEDGANDALWFLPVELAREVCSQDGSSLKKLAVCYELVELPSGHVLSDDGLRWPKETSFTKVTFENLDRVDYGPFVSDEIAENVAFNIILSRQILSPTERDYYLMFSLSSATHLVPASLVHGLRTRYPNRDSFEGLGLDTEYEKFVFAQLFLCIKVDLRVDVVSVAFHTACSQYRNVVQNWGKRGYLDYDEVLCILAVYAMEAASNAGESGGDETLKGGLIFFRVGMLEFYDDDGLRELRNVEGIDEMYQQLQVLLEQPEFSPVTRPPTEHRASGSVQIGRIKRTMPIDCGSRNLSTRHVGVQARIPGKKACSTTFSGRPARLRVDGDELELLTIDMEFVLKVIGWGAASNPFYHLEVRNPLEDRLSSNRIVLEGLNMGLFGETGTQFILSQIVYGEVKVSSKSRNRLFRSLAADEDGVQMDRPARPDFTQQLAACESEGRVYLAIADDILLGLRKEMGRWRVVEKKRTLSAVDGLGQFRTGTHVG